MQEIKKSSGVGVDVAKAKSPKINRADELLNIAKSTIESGVAYDNVGDLISTLKKIQRLKLSPEQKEQFEQVSSKAISSVLWRKETVVEYKGLNRASFATDVIRDAMDISTISGVKFTKSQLDDIAYHFSFGINENIHYGSSIAKDVLFLKYSLDKVIRWTDELLDVWENLFSKLTKKEKQIETIQQAQGTFENGKYQVEFFKSKSELRGQSSWS